MVGLGVVLVFVAADNVLLHYAGMEGMVSGEMLYVCEWQCHSTSRVHSHY